MKSIPRVPYVVSFIALLLLSGCATTSGGNRIERGPAGTIAYEISIEANETGVRIEANNDYIGTAPTTLKVFGDRDGSFHNFGTQDFIIRAFPPSTNQYVQTKIFRTGGWFSQEDQIPRRIFFDMNNKDGGEIPRRY